MASNKIKHKARESDSSVHLDLPKSNISNDKQILPHNEHVLRLLKCTVIDEVEQIYNITGDWRVSLSIYE